jgi:hypothetical protein
MMQVDWTWRLAGLLVVTVGLSSLAAFGAAKITLGLGLGPEAAMIACIAAWLASFFLIDRPQ